MINGVIITPLKMISVTEGDVLHAMKKDDPGYLGFGEAYFSNIEFGAIKAWKRHHEMTLNLIVPVGEIKFVIFDDRNGESTQFQEINISKSNYCRLTVPPMLWIGFQGKHKETNILLNIANIEHNNEEADRVELNEINYNWDLN